MFYPLTYSIVASLFQMIRIEITKLFWNNSQFVILMSSEKVLNLHVGNPLEYLLYLISHLLLSTTRRIIIMKKGSKLEHVWCLCNESYCKKCCSMYTRHYIVLYVDQPLDRICGIVCLTKRNKSFSFRFNIQLIFE